MVLGSDNDWTSGLGTRDNKRSTTALLVSHSTQLRLPTCDLCFWVLLVCFSFAGLFASTYLYVRSPSTLGVSGVQERQVSPVRHESFAIRSTLINDSLNVAML